MSGSGGAYFEYHYSLILPFVYFKKLADWYFGILYPFLDYSLRKLKLLISFYPFFIQNSFKKLLTSESESVKILFVGLSVVTILCP